MLRLVGPSEKSLAELLYQQQQLGEPIPVPLTLSILRQVCEALDWAHNLRDPNGQFLYVLHRDINPAVIFVGANGATRLVASTAAQANCGYVAPEALVGMNPDPRSDIFSLGVVAHEMLTNRPLFHGYNDHDTLARVCSLPIPLPSTINPAVTPDIEGLVLMALTRDPAYRWQSAAMLRDGLVSVAQRNGLEVVAGMEHAWADLIAGRRSVKPEPVLPSVQFSSPPALPQQQPVVPLPPPKDEQWTDDTNMETRIQPADPRIADEQPLDPRGPTAIQDVAAPVSNATASTVVANPERPPQHSVEDPTRALRPADRSPAGGLPSPRASQAPGNLANPSAAKTPRPELAPSKTPRPEPVRPAGPNIANTPRPSPDPAPLPDPSTRPAQPNLANPSARPSQMPASTKLPARPFAIPDIPRPPTPTPTVERPEPAADDSGELPVQIDDSEFAGETRADAAAYVDPEGAGSRAQTAADEHPAEAAELPYSPTLPTDDDPLAQAGSESTDDPDDPVAEPPRPSSPNMFSETPGAATQPSIDALAEPPRKQAAVKRADDDDPLFADLPAPRKQARKPDDDPLADLPSPRKRPADRKPVEDPFADLPSPRRKPDAEPQQASSLFEDLPAPRAASGPTNLPAPRGQRVDDSFAELDTPPKAATPAPLEVPNQRGVALDDLPPAPEKPKPVLRPLTQGPAIPTLPRPPVDPYADMELGPGGPKHERAPTADVEAFVASVAGEGPDFSPGPTSFTPPPGGFPAAPPARPFELELGEFTQIGAAPLVQFGETVNETPMQLVGVGPKPPAPRTSVPTLPPPVAMVSSNRPEEEDDEAPSRKKLLFVIVGALLVLGGAVVAFLILA